MMVMMLKCRRRVLLHVTIGRVYCAEERRTGVTVAEVEEQKQLPRICVTHCQVCGLVSVKHERILLLQAILQISHGFCSYEVDGMIVY